MKRLTEFLLKGHIAPMNSQSNILQRTPLFDEHVRLNARMVPFAGWEMPIQYRGVTEEHLSVRRQVGLFDVSHMGEIRVRGPFAQKTLQWLTTNDVSKLQAGQAQYSLLPNATGGIVDDIIVYCLEPNLDYLVCVNAANIEKDWQWMNHHNQGAELINESSHWAQIAVQGPEAIKLLQTVWGNEVSTLRPFQFARLHFKNEVCLLARTGYTGEGGGEIFIPADLAVALWQELMAHGERLNVQPIGLAARDTLRLEMKYCLYGNDIDDTTNPYEAGLGWVVKPLAKDFVGKTHVMAGKEQLSRRWIGFELIDRGVPRSGYELYSFDNAKIGKVTSGTMSPSLQKPIGVAYVPIELSELGSQFYVEIRGKKVRAQVVKTPFVSPMTTEKE